MTVTELAAKTGYPTDYILHLKGIHDGTEPYCTSDELADVQAWDTYLAMLNLDKED